MKNIDGSITSYIDKKGDKGTKINMTPLENSAAEAASKVHMGEPGHEKNEGNSNADLDKINELRAKVKESAKGYVSFFSVDCISYTTEPEKK